MPLKRIAIFGSTGSIGTQALEVIEANLDKFSIEVLTAHSNDELLVLQAIKFNPNVVVIGDEKKYTKVKDALANTDVKVFAGEKALEEVAAMDCYDFMLAAIVGYAGLKPTLEALNNGKAVALANKETLVVAGDIVMKKAMEKRVPIIPVDSEHSAIFQCLVGETRNKIEKVVLTASGGPFRRNRQQEADGHARHGHGHGRRQSHADDGPRRRDGRDASQQKAHGHWQSDAHDGPRKRDGRNAR